MPKITKTIGLVLILLGVISYIATSAVSFTALIPSFFGVVFYGLGMWGEKNESMRKHAMHAALLLAILGLAGSFGGLISVFGALGGAPIERPAAAFSQSLMALLCIFFLILGIKSFRAARMDDSSEPPTSEEGGENAQS
ncbi:MAG: hypothetical protein ACQER4_06635 [Bacteroidota bacterium]